MGTNEIVRSLDYAGRVLIPKDIRKGINIKPGDRVEIEILNESVVIKKHGNYVRFVVITMIL